MDIVCLALQLYVIVLFARVIFSWFPVAPGSALEGIYDVLRMLTEPVLGPLRRACAAAVAPPLDSRAAAPALTQ